LHALHSSQIGSHVGQILNSDEASAFGQIIATFPTSFYVKTRDDELLFITNRTLRSPITINVEYTGNFTDIAKPLEPVFLHHHQLNNSSLSIDVTNTHEPKEKEVRFNTDPNYLKLMKASILLSTILNVIENAGSVLDRDQLLVHDSIGDFIQHGIMPLRSKEDPSNFVAATSKIIGLGSGFTPSGDDFLLGFLVIYNSLAFAIARRPIYLGSRELAGTSWISAKLVDYAQHLQVDEQLLTMIQSMFDEHGDTVVAIETLLPRGHTSGIDMATGAVFGLSVICDITLRQRKTEVIAAMLGIR
jgi:hypothetical protein